VVARSCNFRLRAYLTSSRLLQIESSGEPITRGSFDECDMMGKVLEAAGLPNEYNTATFVQYMPIIGPVGCSGCGCCVCTVCYCLFLFCAGMCVSAQHPLSFSSCLGR
jgi:hypothetical protein